MPKPILQHASAEGVDLRGLNTLICRVRESSRGADVKKAILDKALALRDALERVGYGTGVPAPPPPPVVAKTSTPAPKATASGSNGKARSAAAR
jgi:hypothetical protein